MAQVSVQESLQEEVIAFSSDRKSYAGADPVERFETHGNMVFLAGNEAWKIKRVVRFPYMDFSSREKRHAACIREVEINRRFGSDLYLGCQPIARSPGGAIAFGSDGEIIEWAVHMRRFEQSALLSAIASDTGVSDDLARALADVVYQAHQRATPAGPCPGAALMGQVARSIAETLAKSGVASPELDLLAGGLRAHMEIAAATLDERGAHGFVRRCHGDLHLANVVMWHGRPALYDAIEFDEAMATIDTLYDLAFLLMDLDRYEQRPAANAVLNRYLWLSGAPLDLKGLIALQAFLALRAAVRALVTADRGGQESGEARSRDLKKARGYLAMATGYLEPSAPHIVAIGGLSGSGKTTVATRLAPRLGRAPGAIHLRTDLERKRQAGVDEFERLPESTYAMEARTRVYQTLNDKARFALRAGQSVIIDAVFADPKLREDVQALAREVGVPFYGLWLDADRATLLKRVAERRADASDATPEVVRIQLQGHQGPFTAAWATIDAGGALADTVDRARIALGTPKDRSS